jgi:hypothetical protein
MYSFWPSLRNATLGAVAFGLASFLAVTPGHAATVLPFNNSGVPTVVGTVNGTGGTMNFTLDVDDPAAFNVFGTFAMDVFGPGNVLLGHIDLSGGPIIDGLGPTDFGAIDPPGVFGGLPNISLWHLDVAGAAQLPLTLQETAFLTGFDPFNPVLPGDLTGDLVLNPVSAVPLPGALPLFATGLAALGLIGRRRRARASKVQPA